MGNNEMQQQDWKPENGKIRKDTQGINGNEGSLGMAEKAKGKGFVIIKNGKTQDGSEVYQGW